VPTVTDWISLQLAQAIIKGKMHEQLAEEWKTLREAGKIPEGVSETEHGLYTCAELMKIIDDECPDEERLEALGRALCTSIESYKIDLEAAKSPKPSECMIPA
jgi:hypothetical protein